MDSATRRGKGDCRGNQGTPDQIITCCIILLIRHLTPPDWEAISEENLAGRGVFRLALLTAQRIPSHVADAVLGHKEATLGFERYTGDRDRYLLHEKRDALQKWDAFTMEAVAGPPPGYGFLGGLPRCQREVPRLAFLLPEGGSPSRSWRGGS